MKQSMPWKQLARYFAGELTDEELQKMKSWINADLKREHKVRRLYKVWKESGVPPYQLNVDEAWARLSGNMEQLEEKPERVDQVLIEGRARQKGRQPIQKDKKVRRAGSVKRIVVTTLTAAATILIAILFAYQYEYDRESQKVTEEYTVQKLVTKEGERATYKLSDGSKVVLHPGSRLEVPSQFNVDNRELFLEGEAYFEVTHDTDNPFIVNSERAYTRVLGTKFLVQAWSGRARINEVEVVVTEGKVALGDTRNIRAVDNNKEAIIMRNQKGLLSGHTGPVVSDIDDLDWYMGWTEGRLVFDNRSLNEIIPRLEHWYAVEIQLEDRSLEAKKITGEIDHSQPMGEVLKGIAMSLDLEYEKENRTVTFRVKEKK